MTPEEKEAFDLASEVVSRAEREWWPFLNLCPYVLETGEPRSGFQPLLHLTQLPPEVSSLTRCNSIELRGTKISDLTPLASLKQLKDVQFEGIPACEQDSELSAIAKVPNPSARTKALLDWLSEKADPDPPELLQKGPQFHIGDNPPISLIDPLMSSSDDSDQNVLLSHIRTKAEDLNQIANLAGNAAPRLPRAVERYLQVVSSEAPEIGARAVWSHANTLESILEIHENAIKRDRPNDELPPSVASCLSDLLETHRVWFLGHPGAREVEARASHHRRRAEPKRLYDAAVGVVNAATKSSVVSDQATAPARVNIETASENTPSGVAALGEIEDWTWNFIASIARKTWSIASAPPGGFLVHTVGGLYLTQFVIANEVALKLYATEFMANGPIWWDAMLAMHRRIIAYHENETGNG
ncbi:MAG: hypothetical protein RID15_19150 [Marinovum algicola]|uniref:Uncharacterized protein n=1 Tax=Marinovum algicola TaxID=42444 RepID=A0A975W839_9RHOB|nr:hypothetical protein [Marinovum algicola]SEJ03204.1 hypothetical protein SAMN04487940_10314 [Marinovum algicola]SLN18247.1 hypothetical protein MAA5396_00526 [Marinovum algicola]